MTTTITSIDSSTSSISVGGVEALRLSTTGLPSIAGINGGQLAGFRNRIRNGTMEFAQRGTSIPVTTSLYTLDGWIASFNGGSAGTITQASDVPSDNEFQYSMRTTITTADASITGSDYGFISQIIEGYCVRDLIGQTFTFSFKVRSPKTGTHCIAFRNSGNDRSYIATYTVNTINTWETKSITVTGGLITAGTWNWTNGRGLEVSFILACGTTFHTTAGAWQTGNYLATSAQVNCMDTVGNIFAITGVQIEKGPLATPFEHLDIAVEDTRNRRYFRTWGAGAKGIWNGTTTVRIAEPLSPTMRSTPTGTLITTTPYMEHWAAVNYVGVGSTIATQLSSPYHAEFVLTGWTGPATSTPRPEAYSPANIIYLSAEL